jgi:hypothetical protein
VNSNGLWRLNAIQGLMRFGTVRPRVQIPGARPKSELTLVTVRERNVTRPLSSVVVVLCLRYTLCTFPRGRVLARKVIAGVVSVELRRAFVRVTRAIVRSGWPLRPEHPVVAIPHENCEDSWMTG